MKLVLVALTLALVAAALAAPVDDATAQVVRSNFDQSPEGGYVQSFETDNGIKVQETGEVKELLDEENKPHLVVVQRGSYSYTDPEGQAVAIEYYADDTGFHAEGDRIPKPQ